MAAMRFGSGIDSLLCVGTARRASIGYLVRLSLNPNIAPVRPHPSEPRPDLVPRVGKVGAEQLILVVSKAILVREGTASVCNQRVPKALVNRCAAVLEAIDLKRQKRLSSSIHEGVIKRPRAPREQEGSEVKHGD